MILPLRPKSLIRDFDYSDLWRHAESRGGNVLSFVRHERKDARRDNRGTAIENRGVSARPGSCPENPPTSQEDKPISDAEIHSARIQFARSQGQARVSGTVEGHGGPSQTDNRQSQQQTRTAERFVKSAGDEGETDISDILGIPLERASEYQASPADLISLRRRPNGTYKNFPSLWAAFWLLVGLVKSGR